MDYEKKYKEALEKARPFSEHPLQEDSSNIVEYIFPELNESKSIRLWLIDLLSTMQYHHCDEDMEMGNKALAWLEAQGEQKTTDKVEPKFKFGDWVVSPNGVYWHIDKISNDRYEVTSNTGESSNWNLDTNIYHKFTIQDAKDGDVLYFNDGHGNDCIELIKSITDKKIEFWFCLTNGNRYEVFDGIIPYTNLVSRENATPATKEQRDQLEKAMADAGYRWNPDEKKMEKIEQKPTEWTEEDEKMYTATIFELAGFMGNEDKLDWLKSLKDRVPPQKQEWNYNDEIIIETIIQEIEKIPSEKFIDNAKYRCLDWLRYRTKSLRPHSQWKPSK